LREEVLSLSYFLHFFPRVYSFSWGPNNLTVVGKRFCPTRPAAEFQQDVNLEPLHVVVVFGSAIEWFGLERRR